MAAMRVLLLGNAEATLSTIGVELIQLGMAISTAQHVDEALAQLARNTFDALVIDDPRLDQSITRIDRFRQQQPDLALILLAAQPEPAAITAVLAAGAYDVLVGPPSVLLLEAAVRRAQERRELRSRVAAGTQSGSASLLHDVNNQLSGIIGLAQLYHSDPSLPAELRDDLDGIISSARRIRELIQIEPSSPDA